MLLRANPQSITPPRNDREVRDPLIVQRLAVSILKLGLLQPFRVFRNEQGELEMLCGETRRLAAIEAGLTQVAALLREGSSPTKTEILLERWHENTLRKKETPSDQVAIVLAIQQDNPDWSYETLADSLGISQASVTRLLLPFQLLPEHLRGAIDSGEILPSYAYYLSQIAHLPEELERIVSLIRAKKINKRDALVKHVGAILNRTPQRAGLTHEFEHFKVISKESTDPTISFRIAAAAHWAALRMKADGRTSQKDFWCLVGQYFMGNGDHTSVTQ